MLRANHAVRLGLRAASRNPELAFGKAVLDLFGNALALLPLVFGFVLVAAAVGDEAPLAAVLHGIALARALSWSMAGAVLAALALAWALSMFFWAGALPLLAADAEMDARPPPGNFLRLAVRGFARTSGAGALGAFLSAGFGLGASAAALAAVVGLARPRPVELAALAAFLVFAFLAGLAVDLLARLMLVRAAALGEPVAVSFARAASLLGARLGACFTIAAAFVLLELVVAAAAATITGALDGSLDPARALLALGPRGALAIASGVVFSWLETGRLGALAALAADAEGLLPSSPAAAHEPEPAPLAEPVIEALPVDESPPVGEDGH
jgi:hypothetical protein